MSIQSSTCWVELTVTNMNKMSNKNTMWGKRPEIALFWGKKNSESEDASATFSWGAAVWAHVLEPSISQSFVVQSRTVLCRAVVWGLLYSAHFEGCLCGDRGRHGTWGMISVEVWKLFSFFLPFIGSNASPPPLDFFISFEKPIPWSSMWQPDSKWWSVK